MKLTLRFLLPSLLGAALAAPAMASTNLIFGFYDFDAGTSAENADVGPGPSIGADFSLATVTKAIASSDAGGSSDEEYGATAFVVQNAPNGAPLGNGFLALSSTNTVFSVTNQSLVDYVIYGLSFDVRGINSTSGTRSFAVTYAVTNATSGNVFSTSTVANYNGTSNYADYSDYDVNTSIVVPAGETLSLIFRSTGTAQLGLDNIAVVGEEFFQTIPEPSSLLALGCLISSGLAFRSRRRKAVA